MYAIAFPAASLRVTLPLRVPGGRTFVQLVTVKPASRTTPLRDKAANVFVPATIAYGPAPSAKTVLAGAFVPVSISTAKVCVAGTVRAADQLIVLPVPVPVLAAHVVVEPAAAAAPSMKRPHALSRPKRTRACDYRSPPGPYSTQVPPATSRSTRCPFTR